MGNIPEPIKRLLVVLRRLSLYHITFKKLKGLMPYLYKMPPEGQFD